MTSVIDLHLSSTYYTAERRDKLGHCQMVNWLLENFNLIQGNDISYQDYAKYGNTLGIITYCEESFNVFKQQQYV